MRPALHVIARGLFAFVCWVGALVAFVVLHCWYLSGPDKPSDFRRVLAYFGIAIGATIVTAITTEVVFRFLIVARCRRCNARVQPTRERTIVYRCRACGYEYDTGWSSNSGGGGGFGVSGGGGCGGGGGGCGGGGCGGGG